VRPAGAVSPPVIAPTVISRIKHSHKNGSGFELGPDQGSVVSSVGLLDSEGSPVHNTRPGGFYLYGFNPAWSRGNVVGSLRSKLSASGVEELISKVEFGRSNSGMGLPRLIIRTEPQYSARVWQVLKEWALLVKAKASHERLTSAPVGPKRVYKPRHGIATWNLNSFTGKKTEVLLAAERMRIGILALQETMVRGLQWAISLPGYNVYNVPAEPTIPGARGLALAVGKAFSSYLVEARSHWMLVRVHGLEQGRGWNILNVYVPQNRAQRVLVFRELKAVLRRLNANDNGHRLVVMGDCNMRAQTFLKKLQGAGTGLTHVEVTGSDKTLARGKHWTAIDHMFVGGGTRPCISKCSVRRDIKVSDHLPLYCRVKLEFLSSAVSEKRKVRLDGTRLLEMGSDIVNDDLWKGLLGRLKGIKAGAIPLDEVAPLWDDTSTTVAQKHGCYSAPRGQKLRINSEARAAVDAKREAWQSLINARGPVEVALQERYKLACKAAKATIAVVKEAEWIKHLERGVSRIREGDLRGFYQWVNRTTKYKGVRQSASIPIKDDYGTVQYDQKLIAELWGDHFAKLAKSTAEGEKDYEELANEIPQHRDFDVLDDVVWDRRFSWPELQECFRELTRHKAGDSKGLIAEWYLTMIDSADPDTGAYPPKPRTPMAKVFLKLVNAVWVQSYVPNEWTVAQVIAIPKKGDLAVRDNYRGISLINVFVKVLDRLVIGRLTQVLDSGSVLVREQAAFRRKEEAIGQVLALVEVTKRRELAKKPTILFFNDFAKAYDLVPHEAIYAKLVRYGFRTEGRLLQFIKAVYSSAKFEVVVGPYKSRTIELERGVRQGAPSSCLLYNVYVNDLAIALRDTGVDVPGVEQLLGSLLFADDTVETIDSVQDLVTAVETTIDFADRWDASIGVPKCGIMVPGDNEDAKALQAEIEELGLTIKGVPIPVVEEYDYLGVRLQREGFSELTGHVAARIERLNTRMEKLTPYLGSKSIPMKCRLNIYKTVALPLIRWGLELLGPGKFGPVGDAHSAMMKSIKILVGTTYSKNTVFAHTCLLVELGLKPFHQMVIEARVRLYYKSRLLQTWPALLLEGGSTQAKWTWKKGTEIWLKSYVKADVGTCDYAETTRLVRQYFADKVLKELRNTSAGRQYCKWELSKTRAYLDTALKFPALSRGVNWLTRLRISGIWTGRRAVLIGLVDESLDGVCPACLGEIGSVPELQHIVMTCPRLNAERDEYLNVLLNSGEISSLSEAKQYRFVCGGSLDGVSRTAWSGENGEVLPGLSMPGFWYVARFLESAMPVYMRALWD
jgi:exonuclease III